MAICFVCRFYHFSLEDVKNLTLKEFEMLNENMVKISEIENPTPESEKPKKLSAGSFGKFAKKKKNNNKK